MSDRDLANHHKVLRQFLDVSDDSSTRSKSNSSRAVRAREKLLKLSPAQFRELSTDVYDELQRRIDESRGVPSYLLPKQSFHPKRNQARQKLASLPQSRFKDLVGDISYEIERRGLDLEKGPTRVPSPPPAPVEHPTISSSPKPLQTEKGLPQVPAPATATNGSSTVGVQSTTVVPTKATLSWSSDEDEPSSPKPKTPIKSPRVAVAQSPLEVASLREQLSKMTLERETNISKIVELEERLATAVDPDTHADILRSHDTLERKIYDLEQKTAVTKDLWAKVEEAENKQRRAEDRVADLDLQLQEALDDVTEATAHREAAEAGHRQLKSEHDDLHKQHYELNDLHAALKAKHQTLGKEYRDKFQQTREREIDVSKTEVNRLQNKLADASAESEVLKQEIRRLEQESRQLQERSTQERTIQDRAVAVPQPTKVPDDLRSDMDIFLQKMATIETAHPGSAHSQQQAEFWQKKYEESRSAHYGSVYANELSEKAMSPLISPSGLISLQLIADCHAYIDSFMAALGSKSPDVSVLFDKVSKLSVVASQIASQAEVDGPHDGAVVVRESASFALTSTRYYAVYHQLVPKVVVERAISAVVFSVCELASTARLREHSVGNREIPAVKKVEKKANHEELVGKPLRVGQRPRDDQDNSKVLRDVHPKERDVPGKNKPIPEPISVPRTTVAPLITNSGSTVTPFKVKSPKIVEQTLPVLSSQPVDHTSDKGTEAPTTPSNPAPVAKALHRAPSTSELPSSKETEQNLKLERKESVEFAPPPMRRQSSQSSIRSNESTSSKTGFFSMIKRAVSGKQVESDNDSASIHSVGSASSSKSANRRSIQIRNLDSAPSRTMSIKDLDRANEMVSRGLDFDEPPREGDSEPSDGEPLDNSTFDTDSPSSTAHTSPNAVETPVVSKAKKDRGSQDNLDDDSTATADKSLFSDTPNKRQSVYSMASVERDPVPTKILDHSEDPAISPESRRTVTIDDNIQHYSESDSEYEYDEDVQAEIEREQYQVVSPTVAAQRGFHHQVASPLHEERQAMMREAQIRERQELAQLEADRLEAERKEAERKQLKMEELAKERAEQERRQKELREIELEEEERTRQREIAKKKEAEEIEKQRVREEAKARELAKVKEAAREREAVKAKEAERVKEEARREEKRLAEEKRRKEEEKIEEERIRVEREAEREAELKAAREAELKAAKEAELKAEREAQLAENEAKIKAEKDAKLRAEKEAKLKAEEEALISAKKESAEREASRNGNATTRALSSAPTADHKQPRPSAMKASPILKSSRSVGGPTKRVKMASPELSSEEESEESDEDSEDLEDDSDEESEEDEDDDEDEDEDEDEDVDTKARQRQEYRKSMAAATFNVDLFDIEDPDNTLTQVLLYLEHQTVQVITTIQSLLQAIKKPESTRGELRDKSKAIAEVISQMTEATNTSMNQTRNASLKAHGQWVVRSLEDCETRMKVLCKPSADKKDSDYADKNFKQRLAGISFDIAKCTKELVKTVEEASLKEDIEYLNRRIKQGEQ